MKKGIVLSLSALIATQVMGAKVETDGRVLEVTKSKKSVVDDNKQLGTLNVHLKAVTVVSDKNNGFAPSNGSGFLAKLKYESADLFTDGLKDEREQGITIDVAYRYFTTPKRKFIIADTPGHIQYTRNMVTGASTANAALILIDSRHGVIEQTKRHAFIASLLQIPHMIVCVNKMDLVNFSEDTYNTDLCSNSAKISFPIA